MSHVVAEKTNQDICTGPGICRYTAIVIILCLLWLEAERGGVETAAVFPLLRGEQRTLLCDLSKSFLCSGLGLLENVVDADVSRPFH